MRLARRHFLKGTLASAFAGALPAVLARRAWASHYGPLIADPAGVLDLPEGFSYRVVDRGGDVMSDGYLVPREPDGMGVFEGSGGEWILMRNHELSGTGPGGPYAEGQAPPSEAYDPGQNGAVTRVVLDPISLERLSSNLVLAGTVRNCAGGVSPWGWLSCEETTILGHGYVFLCDPRADVVQPYDRVDAYGRFNHEAACVDPRSNIAYLTEDRFDGGLYRFMPDQALAPRVGRLQAMKVVGADRFNTAQGLVWGDSLKVEWVDIPDPTPVADSVRAQAGDAGSNSHLRALDASGATDDFARTTLSELAGVCFSPDGRALFVNVQHANLTLVVTGPFPEVAVVAPDADAGAEGPAAPVLGEDGASNSSNIDDAGGDASDRASEGGRPGMTDASAYDDSGIGTTREGGPSASGGGGPEAHPRGGRTVAETSDAATEGSALAGRAASESAPSPRAGGCACDVSARTSRGRSAAFGATAIAAAMLSRRRPPS